MNAKSTDNHLVWMAIRLLLRGGFPRLSGGTIGEKAVWFRDAIVLGKRCLPTYSTTFFFAYSNDLDPNVVLDALLPYRYPVNSIYTFFANVRFDMQTPENIQYHTKYDDMHLSVLERLPNRTLGFPSASSSSDILHVLEDFLSRPIAPVCGSRFLIFMKRLVNNNYVDQLVEDLQRMHVSMDVIISNTPSGGLDYQTIYELVSKTNGLCVFESDDYFPSTSFLMDQLREPYTVYSVNVPVSGTGSISLPQFISPRTGSYCSFRLAMTVQDHGPLDSYRTAKLSWQGENKESGKLDDSSSSLYNSNGTLLTTSDLFFSLSPYNMTLDYDYSNNQTQILQIRIFTYVLEKFCIVKLINIIFQTN
uniref:CUB domain-containing protein n=1 Tax=Caenorhabditis tropicalis TaxID=1561998 RepID=A0A1I7TTP7_9PELO